MIKWEPVHNFSIDQIKEQIKENAESFNAPTSSAEAAEIILSAVKRKNGES